MGFLFRLSQWKRMKGNMLDRKIYGAEVLGHDME